MIFEELPPSANRIFVRSKFGVFLSKEAKAYAEKFSHHVVQNYGSTLHQASFLSDLDVALEVRLLFYFEKLDNETWKGLTPAEKAKGGVQRKVKKRNKKTKEMETLEQFVHVSRYKRLDTDNRVKLVQDCIMDAIDVDDSHIFSNILCKFQDPKRPRVEVFIEPVDVEQFLNPGGRDDGAEPRDTARGNTEGGGRKGGKDRGHR